MATYKKIEHRRKEIREKASKGISVRDLCREYGLHPNTVYRYLTPFGILPSKIRTKKKSHQVKTLHALGFSMREIAQYLKHCPAYCLYLLKTETDETASVTLKLTQTTNDIYHAMIYKGEYTVTQSGPDEFMLRGKDSVTRFPDAAHSITKVEL